MDQVKTLLFNISDARN